MLCLWDPHFTTELCIAQPEMISFEKGSMRWSREAKNSVSQSHCVIPSVLAEGDSITRVELRRSKDNRKCLVWNPGEVAGD